MEPSRSARDTQCIEKPKIEAMPPNTSVAITSYASEPGKPMLAKNAAVPAGVNTDILSHV
jgi:hypothetical protein